MPKKSSSVKATEKAPEKNPVVEEDETPSSKPKQSSNEIDEIFAGKKRKKPEGKKAKKLNKDETADPKLVKKNNKKKKKSEGDTEDDGFPDPSPANKPRKRTEDGLTVYTEDELGINNADAGNTPLCPFDCSCCF